MQQQTQPLTATSILAALSSDRVEFSNDQLREASRLIGSLHRKNEVRAGARLRLGMPVQFTHAGQTIHGVVRGFNSKTVSVMGSDGRPWRVSPSLLSEAVAGAANDAAPAAPTPSMPVVGTSAFTVGQRVAFTGPRGEEITGTVVRINARTVSVDSDAGVGWRVPPHQLRPTA